MFTREGESREVFSGIRHNQNIIDGSHLMLSTPNSSIHLLLRKRDGKLRLHTLQGESVGRDSDRREEVHWALRYVNGDGKQQKQ